MYTRVSSCATLVEGTGMVSSAVPTSPLAPNVEPSDLSARIQVPRSHNMLCAVCFSYIEWCFLNRLAVWAEAAKERIARLQAQLTSKTSAPPPSVPGTSSKVCSVSAPSMHACGRSTGHRNPRRCLYCWKPGCWPGPSCPPGSHGLVPCACSWCLLRQCLEDGF